MGNLAIYQKGFAFKSEDYRSSGTMITKIQNLSEGNSEKAVFIDPERASEFKQYVISEGDLVMTTVGSWFSAPMSAVGRTFLIDKRFDGSLLNQNAVRIRFLDGIVPKYLLILLKSSFFGKYILQEAQGTANQASITQDCIKNFLIFIPPLQEQHRIVSKVDELMNICKQLKSCIIDAKLSEQKLADVLVETAAI